MAIDTTANPDQSMFDKASAAVSPWLNAWNTYEQQKTERQKIDLLKNYQDQQLQLGGIDYDQRMRSMLGMGYTTSGGKSVQGDGGLMVVIIGIAAITGVIMLIKS